MIYVDDTEMRARTRLPEDVQQRATVLVGLEDLTGADILLCNVPEIGDLETLPAQARLRRACAEGILVQRKTYRDICSSIPTLKDHLCKMLQWSSDCWLLVTGQMVRIEDTIAVFKEILSDDKKSRATILYELTQWKYAPLLAAIDKWQRRGGYVAWLSDNNSIGIWLDVAWHVKETLTPEERIIHRTPQQALIASDWRDTLATLPGIGEKRANEWAGETLALTLCVLSEADGSKTRHNIRQYLGLKDGFKLAIVPEIDVSISETEEIEYQ